MAFKMLFTIFVIFCFTFSLMPTTTKGLPFVVFHGIADKCKNKGVTDFVEILSNWSSAQGYCIEIGNGAQDSWFMPFLKQIDIACEKVKKMSELSGGYNIVGLSQGNLVGRGVVEFCDGSPPSALLCTLVDSLHKLAIYSDFVQEHLAPAEYVKIPTDIDDYMKGCKFLPKLNNEIKGHRNATYKERFSSLHTLVLIMFEQDNVLVPKETAWFGYFEDGSLSTVLPPQETKLYIEDWIGLRTLDEAGKVKFINVTGNHLDISLSDIEKYVLPYLKDKEAFTPLAIAEMPRIKSFSAWSSIKKVVGLTR